MGVHAPYNTPAEDRIQDRPDNRPPGGEDQQALPVDLTRTAGLTTADEERPRAEVGQTKSWWIRGPSHALGWSPAGQKRNPL